MVVVRGGGERNKEAQIGIRYDRVSELITCKSVWHAVALNVCALFQVFRIPSGQTEPDLVLGEKFVPGKDDTHFCKPTDVAVADNGDFFVSDG